MLYERYFRALSTDFYVAMFDVMYDNYLSTEDFQTLAGYGYV